MPFLYVCTRYWGCARHREVLSLCAWFRICTNCFCCCSVTASGPRRICCASRRLQKTSKLERVMCPVRVVDRTHPLFGKTLALLSERCGRGKAFIAVALQDGRRRLVSRSATDLDTHKRQPLPTSKISARSLLPLARHVRCYLAGVNVEGAYADRSRPDSSKTSFTPTQHPTVPASAGSRVTGSPKSARSGDRKDPAAPSRRGPRPC